MITITNIVKEKNVSLNEDNLNKNVYFLAIGRLTKQKLCIFDKMFQ